MLGDIDGKYSHADPLLDVSYHAFPDSSRAFEDRTEKKTIHQPLAGTIFRGIEEDLERLIRSPERARYVGKYRKTGHFIETSVRIRA